MTPANLTVVPPIEGAPSAPPEGAHPMERARAALREAAMLEHGELRRLLLRIVEDLPRRSGRGTA
jgi:hypothetical protein